MLYNLSIKSTKNSPAKSCKFEKHRLHNCKMSLAISGSFAEIYVDKGDLKLDGEVMSFWPFTEW